MLNSYYNISSNEGSTSTSQCVFASLNQNFAPADLRAFQSHFGLNAQNISTSIGITPSNSACVVNGGSDCIEASLDVQYMMAISQVTPTTFYYVDESGDFWLEFVTAVSEMESPPKVISISYGSYESSLDQSYIDTFNTEAMKLGLMGGEYVSLSEVLICCALTVFAVCSHSCGCLW